MTRNCRSLTEPPPVRPWISIVCLSLKNEPHEDRHARAQYPEKLIERAAPVGRLLMELRHHENRLLSQQFGQELLRMDGTNVLGGQMLIPKVAKVESHDERSVAVHRSRRHVTVFLIVPHQRNE